MPINILVFEDNDLLRESLSSLVALNPELALVGAYPHVLQVKNQIHQLKPDVILMDIDMPGRTGIEAVREIRSFNTNLPVIMLTVFDDNIHVLEAIKAGASGYLLKKHISSKLFDSVKEVLEGGAPMSPSIARMVINSMQRPSENLYDLTVREREILTVLSTGNSYKMIAAQFNISIDTVRTHIKKIYEKLQVHSQTEAVSKAINEKLV
ncbi:MAG: response regulator transcription factor [Cyclobacteriaceae bacterium]|nr:response regulator transcription factor [Cyclobacteriaceae bacterium]